MTIANQITIARILLIPVFVLFYVYFGRSVETGEPQEWLRIAAIGVFILASLTDGIDGYVARHWNQRSRLGAILDPIADKGLLLTAILTLSFGHGIPSFPLWFSVVVLGRDALILIGCGLLFMHDQKLDVRPSWLGKMSTAAQMVAIAWIMLPLPHYLVSVYIAGMFTLLSGVDYLFRGICQLRHHENKH